MKKYRVTYRRDSDTAWSESIVTADNPGDAQRIALADVEGDGEEIYVLAPRVVQP